MSEKEMLYTQIDGPVGHIVLNRPDKKNALTWAMWDLLSDAVDALATNSTVKVVIVRGVDETVFAAGADIAEFEKVYATEESSLRFTRSMWEAEQKLSGLSKPTIALIQGPCMGAGCAIALCCDLRFADNSARFSIPPARLGLMYGLGDTKRLVNAVGPSKAKDMLYSARVLKAEEAFEIGLIDRLLEPSDLVSQTNDYALSIAKTSRFTHTTMKKIIDMILNGAEDDSEQTYQFFLDAVKGEDFHEGRSAFLEKRPPKFQ